MDCGGGGWKSCQCEEEADDYFIEEEDGDEDRNSKRRNAQKEVKNAGMLLVSEKEWKTKLKEKLIQACKDKNTLEEADFEEIFEKVERAGKATCFVVRRSNCRKCGSGTGLLISPKSVYGWLIITNNHLSKDEEEAKLAEVHFDYEVEGSKESIKMFEVSRVVSKDLRTDNPEDVSHLDFTILALKSDEKDDAYLKERAMLFEESARVNAYSNAGLLDMCGLQFVPLIAFSHPRGLAKRLSIAQYPSECEKYPIAHVKHQLPTTKGSSGANLLYPCPGSNFRDWWAAFLHYRHGRAVAWQAIGPMLRKDLNTPETQYLFQRLLQQKANESTV